MVTVDAKGRITLPQDLREELGVEPGTEVAVRRRDDRVVIEPEDDPEAIVADLEDRIEAPYDLAPPIDDPDPIATDHVDAIRRGAGRDE
jgi:AbrB family looped-hinge helix DNA binding protein